MAIEMNEANQQRIREMYAEQNGRTSGYHQGVQKTLEAARHLFGDEAVEKIVARLEDRCGCPECTPADLG